jgi:hypothetical protein
LSVALLRGSGRPPRIAVPRVIDTSHEVTWRRLPLSTQTLSQISSL